MHQIRKTGNNAVHSYYHSREAVVTYYECCYNIYEKFIKKYESDRINYNKKLMRTYIYQIKEEKIKADTYLKRYGCLYLILQSASSYIHF